MMVYPYRYAPGAEVSGAVMSAIFNHYRRDEVINSLRKHHLDYFEPDQWYLVDQFINLLAECSQQPSFSSNLISVGMPMIYHIEPADEIFSLSSLEKLLMLGDLHMSQHRNGDAGGYTVTQLADQAIRYTENTVWPDDMIYGYLYGAAKRFLEPGTHFILRYADQHDRQEMGGQSTTLDLTWE